MIVSANIKKKQLNIRVKKMSKRDEFIKSLNKYELAYLFAYKFDEYMEGTQKTIKGAMTSAGISEGDVVGLIEESKAVTIDDGKQRCRRCNSDKFFFFETDVTNRSSLEIKLDDKSFSNEMLKDVNQECSVCGFKENLGVSKDNKDYHKTKRIMIWVAVGYIAIQTLWFILK